MNKTARSHIAAAIALAACSFTLTGAAGEDRIIDLQVTPAGNFRPRDGRELKVPHWHIDAALAAKVIARFNARQTPTVIDYEHQTLHKEKNGQPAHAAGWIRELRWEEGKGLFARAEMTARAIREITDGEYKLFSPVFTYDALTGDVLDLQMGALTNFPALDGLEPLTARAAATFGINPLEESPVNPLLKAVLAALGLADTTTEEQAIAACSALNLAELRTQLGVDAKAGVTEMVAACTSLKTQAAATTPDPKNFVPVSVVEALKGELAALTGKINGKEVDELVAAGLESGKLLPAQEKWARELGGKDVAALTAYLDATQPIAALTSTQTGGKPPAAQQGEHKLTAEELAVCSATGVDPKAFAAAKA